MASRILYGNVVLPVAMISTSVQASIGSVIEAELPLLEVLLVGAAAAASVLVVWFRQRFGAVRIAFGMHPGTDMQNGADGLPDVAHGVGRTGVNQVVTPAGSHVVATTLRLRDCDPEAWDSFAQDCGASYRSAYPWLRAWALKWGVKYSLKVFEFRAAGQKMGQCAVGIAKSERIFLDRLQLTPGYEHLWSQAMAAVLAQLGPGRYRYGWHLNLEPAREQQLARIPGVVVEAVQPLTVHAIDFRQWSSWNDYWKSTSSNTRRNAKRAEAEGLQVEVRKGFSSLLHAAPLVRLRSVMYERKGIKFEALKVLASYVVSYVASPKYNVTAIASDHEQALAGFSGMEFGTHTYYIDGGSRPANKGAAWYLQRWMLQRAWERDPGRAMFVMGYVDFATHDESVGGGLLRSRKALRASDYETSVVTFAFGCAPTRTG